MANDSSQIDVIIGKYVEHITNEMKHRGADVALMLHEQAVDHVLKGARSGRVYRKPNTKANYRASAPGEPPAIRTGNFRVRWQPKSYAEGNSVHSEIYNNARTDSKNGKSYLLGEVLEEGTKKMAPRPYKEKILEGTRKKALRKYSEPYF